MVQPVDHLLLGLLTFLVFLVHGVEELFHGDVVNRQKFAKALDGNVSLSFLYPPVLHARQIEVIRKILMAGVAFLLAQ